MKNLAGMQDCLFRINMQLSLIAAEHFHHTIQLLFIGLLVVTRTAKIVDVRARVRQRASVRTACMSHGVQGDSGM